MTRPLRESAAPFDPSLRQTRAELDLDERFTELEREVIKGLFADTAALLRYASEGTTDDELADLFGIPVIAFAPFKALLAKSRAELKHRLRRAHLAAAEKGSPDALAYLTAEYLDPSRKTNSAKSKGKA